MSDATAYGDHRIIPADKLELTAEEAEVAEGLVGAAADRRRARFGVSDGTYFSANVRKRLADKQVAESVPIDGIYSARSIDACSGASSRTMDG
jgi:hypothetical protein